MYLYSKQNLTFLPYQTVFYWYIQLLIIEDHEIVNSFHIIPRLMYLLTLQWFFQDFPFKFINLWIIAVALLLFLVKYQSK